MNLTHQQCINIKQQLNKRPLELHTFLSRLRQEKAQCQPTDTLPRYLDRDVGQLAHPRRRTIKPKLMLAFLCLRRATTSTATTIVATPVRNWLQALLFYWTTLCRIIWLYVPYSSRRLTNKDYEISPRLIRSATFTGRRRRRWWWWWWWRRRHADISRNGNAQRPRSRIRVTGRNEPRTGMPSRLLCVCKIFPPAKSFIRQFARRQKR